LKDKDYELIEHTADIGIRITSPTLECLFQEAALALFNIIAEKKTKRCLPRKEVRIHQKAEFLDELFVNWLNELLSLSAAKGLIFDEVEINKITANSIDAVAVGAAIKHYLINTEIKAATYHNLKIENKGAHWQAEVIFDV